MAAESAWLNSGPRRQLLLAAGLASAMAGASALAQQLVPRRLLADARPRRSLASMVPEELPGWSVARQVHLVAPAPDVQQALDRVYDDALARAYISAQDGLVMLSLAYSRQQRGEAVLHRPEVCYAGQGFSVTPHAGDGDIVLGRRRLRATRLVTHGPRREPVTYWLVLGAQVVRFGLDWRRATLALGLRGEVADGLLVRLSSLDRDPERAFRLHDRFARDLAAAVGPEVGARLFGEGP
jgi:EpsI family protein